MSVHFCVLCVCTYMCVCVCVCVCVGEGGKARLPQGTPSALEFRPVDDRPRSPPSLLVRSASVIPTAEEASRPMAPQGLRPEAQLQWMQRVARGRSEPPPE